jgi:hypothetical protein
MFLAFFHQESRRVFRGRRGQPSPFGHSFGGSVDYAGLVAHRGQPPVHLLFRFNTADPAVGVALPRAQWLPLLCAIRYLACALGYRVLSDGKVKILFQEEAKPSDDFPYDGYPEKLPVQPVVLEQARYDPDNVEDVLFYAGVFGYGALSPRQYAKLVRHVKKEKLHDLFGWDSPEAFLEEGCGDPFLQGPPDDGCPDPSCTNHEREASLRPFATFLEGTPFPTERTARDEIRKLWGPKGGPLMIIYQVCPECAAIHVSNQCT